MGFWCKYFHIFCPPKPVEWQLGLSVTPASATTTITSGNRVAEQVIEPSGHRLFKFKTPDFQKGNSGILRVEAPGYYSKGIFLATIGPPSQELEAVTLTSTKPLPQPRGPLELPACASCSGGPYSYDKDLPLPLPTERNFLRADCWGVPVEGLPFVDGGSSEHPERMLTWFLPRYDQATWWQRIFDAFSVRGYTHFLVSWPDARDHDGMSTQQFAGMLHAIKAAGFYTIVAVASKAFDPQDQSPDEWANRLDGPMASWAGLVDEYTVWEWDSFNVPGTWSLLALKHLGFVAHSQGATFWAHFLPAHCSWEADNRGRTGFWQDLGSDVDGLDYQGVSEWDIGNLQSQLVDMLRIYNNIGLGHKLRAFELTASKQFSGDFTEDQANAIGYLALCTKGFGQIWGFGNGARNLDGTVL